MKFNFTKCNFTKSILLVSVVASFSLQQVHANDGAYFMSGNQLVPMHTTQIDVKKEVLDIRLDGEDIVVDVHYELYNAGKPLSLLVGFEALPPSGDVDGLPKNGAHPYMKDFVAKVNNNKVQYEVALVPTEGHWENYSLNLYQPNSPFYFQNGHIQQESMATLMSRMGNALNEVGELYVYHFTANFNSGFNTIDHRYRFKASNSVYNQFNFDYVLKAINRWGDSTIDDFELRLNLGDMVEYNILNSFFNSSDEWEVKGAGKVYPTPKEFDYTNFHFSDYPVTTFAMKNGEVIFKKKNFTPKDDLILFSPYYVPSEEDFDTTKHTLAFRYRWVDFENLGEMDEFSQKVLRNFPFARKGYVFSDAKLQNYYEQQPWYLADPNYKAYYSELSPYEQDYIDKFK